MTLGVNKPVRKSWPPCARCGEPAAGNAMVGCEPVPCTTWGQHLCNQCHAEWSEQCPMFGRDPDKGWLEAGAETEAKYEKWTKEWCEKGKAA